MSINTDNKRFKLKKVAIICGLSLGLFVVLFYVVNFIDLGSKPKDASISDSSQVSTKSNEELKKRIGKGNVSVAGFDDWAKINNITGDNIYDTDSDKDGLVNYLEYMHGTDPSNIDSDGDGFSDNKEIINGYDPDSKGETMTIVSIKIDKIGIDAPMVWSKTDIEDNMLADLEKGVSHYAKTAAPGQKGNMIISGHSSNYIWAKGNYNHIFKDLNNLENGDIILVKTVQRNGRIINYQYKISDKFTTTPNDERIFAPTEAPTLTLSTCWPLGTTLRRVIIKAELVK